MSDRTVCITGCGRGLGRAMWREFLRVPMMIRRGRGVVVNFSSGWDGSVSPEVAVYRASKWAVEGLTRALAQELPEGINGQPRAIEVTFAWRSFALGPEIRARIEWNPQATRRNH